METKSIWKIESDHDCCMYWFALARNKQLIQEAAFKTYLEKIWHLNVQRIFYWILKHFKLVHIYQTPWKQEFLINNDCMNAAIDSGQYNNYPNTIYHSLETKSKCNYWKLYNLSSLCFPALKARYWANNI